MARDLDLISSGPDERPLTYSMLIDPDGSIMRAYGVNSYPTLILIDRRGGKIQGGGNYRPDPALRLFDVHVAPRDAVWECGYAHEGVWLRPLDVEDVATNLGIGTAPTLGHMSTEHIVDMVSKGMFSTTAKLDDGNPDYLQEGVVARAPHGILDRMGRRIMFKIKTKDF